MVQSVLHQSAHKMAGREIPSRPRDSAILQLQVGVRIQHVVLDDVAGLNGLHQALVAGVHRWRR